MDTGGSARAGKDGRSPVVAAEKVRPIAAFEGRRFGSAETQNCVVATEGAGEPAGQRRVAVLERQAGTQAEWATGGICRHIRRQESAESEENRKEQNRYGAELRSRLHLHPMS